MRTSRRGSRQTSFVALSIDATHALRTLPELQSLIEAIRDAPPTEPETHAVEWKSTLDPAGNARDRFNLARHLLGMGNRLSAVAQPAFEGCAYLLVGVEAGRVIGCPVWDPADLDNWLTGFVAPGSPRWHATYVEVDNVQVLVLTVEPPRAGDPIFTLQRDYEKWRAGRIFVRRGGTTQEASPAEVRGLEGRLVGARPTVDLEVMPEGQPEVARVAFKSDAVDEWIAAEAERYNAALKAHRAIRRTHHLASFVGDRRSEQEYIDEVEEYLGNCGERFQALAYRHAIRQDQGELVLAVSNATPGNFEQVEVTLTLPRDVQVFLDDEEPFEVFEAPDPPSELGKGGSFVIPKAQTINLPNKIVDSVVRKRAELIVRYAPVHLRPAATVTLSPVYLSVPSAYSDQLITVAWRATSTSADSWVEGTFSLSVGSDSIEWLPAVEPNDET